LKKFLSNRFTLAAVIALAILAVGASGATAAHLIGSKDIRDNSVKSKDLRDNTVKSKDLRDGTVGLADLDSDVRGSLVKSSGGGVVKQPALTDVIAGAGYTTTWAGDSGASLQTAREECPAGQYALGGGFSTWGGDKDLGGDNKNIQITVSAPYFEGDYVPVDDAGNFRPTEWVVKGYNNGTTDQIVRAWVTCASMTK
jgi:hypothetical protein